MLRVLTRGVIPRCLTQNLSQKIVQNSPQLSKILPCSFHTINSPLIATQNWFYTPKLLSNLEIVNVLSQPKRDLTKFSLRKGKRKTVKAVIKRFYRLNWGGWIRTKAGRHKKMWKKRSSRRRRLRQHVLVTASQSTLLDKMVTKYWRKPKYYVDDPYEPYHQREEFVYTRTKPK